MIRLPHHDWPSLQFGPSMPAWGWPWTCCCCCCPDDHKYRTIICGITNGTSTGGCDTGLNRLMCFVRSSCNLADGDNYAGAVTDGPFNGGGPGTFVLNMDMDCRGDDPDGIDLTFKNGETLMAAYHAAWADWTCGSQNTVSLVGGSANALCSNWPATLVLTPVTDCEFACGTCVYTDNFSTDGYPSAYSRFPISPLWSINRTGGKLEMFNSLLYRIFTTPAAEGLSICVAADVNLLSDGTPGIFAGPVWLTYLGLDGGTLRVHLKKDCDPACDNDNWPACFIDCEYHDSWVASDPPARLKIQITDISAGAGYYLVQCYQDSELVYEQCHALSFDATFKAGMRTTNPAEFDNFSVSTNNPIEDCDPVPPPECPDDICPILPVEDGGTQAQIGWSQGDCAPDYYVCADPFPSMPGWYGNSTDAGTPVFVYENCPPAFDEWSIVRASPDDPAGCVYRLIFWVDGEVVAQFISLIEDVIECNGDLTGIWTEEFSTLGGDCEITGMGVRFLYGDNPLYGYCDDCRYCGVSYTSCQQLVTALGNIDMAAVSSCNFRSIYVHLPVPFAAFWARAEMSFLPQPSNDVILKLGIYDGDGGALIAVAYYFKTKVGWDCDGANTLERLPEECGTSPSGTGGAPPWPPTLTVNSGGC